MVPVPPDAREVLEQLRVQALGQQAVHELRAPLRRPPLHGLEEHLRMGGDPVPGVLHHQVHEGVVMAALQHVFEHAGQRGGPVRLHHVPLHQLAEQVLDDLVVRRGHGLAGGAGDLDRHALGVLPGAQPAAQRRGHLQGLHLLPGHVRVQEVVLHEVLQGGTELVLLPRDQGRVRHRHPHRVPEQGGHGEPVRERTDHASLGRGTDEGQPRVPVLEDEGHHEDDRQEHEQARGHALHAAQVAGTGVHGGVHPGHAEGRRAGGGGGGHSEAPIGCGDDH